MNGWKVNFPKNNWYPENPLRTLTLIAPQAVEYVIVGKDPYPIGATGIPFHKESWKDFIHWGTKTTFLNLFRSRYDIHNFDKFPERFKSPIEIFEDLADKGFLFLNADLAFCEHRERHGLCKNCCRDVWEPTLRQIISHLNLTKVSFLPLGKKAYNRIRKLFQVRICQVNGNDYIPHPSPLSRHRDFYKDGGLGKLLPGVWTDCC